MRFAFYGRMSTSVFQDVQTLRAWQRAVSDELIEGIGSVVAEFFDVGVSRRWSWQGRPEAAALLAVAADPDRDFDAVVVGEYERAFHGDQLYEPLLDDETFVAVQGMRVAKPAKDGEVWQSSSSTSCTACAGSPATDTPIRSCRDAFVRAANGVGIIPVWNSTLVSGFQCRHRHCDAPGCWRIL